MKKLLLALALLWPSALWAQGSGSVANHAVVLGRGPGVTGFGAVVPGTAGLALTSNGAGVDPSFQSLTLAPGAVTNSLLASMAANTLKANITAAPASPTDVVIPQCDSTGQWLDYTPVTGFTCVSLTATAGALVVNGQLTVNGAIIDTSGNATLKSVLIPGSTSGTVTQNAQAVAGTPIVTWGTATGTPAVTASAPLSISTATGNITCALCTTSSGGGALSATAPITLTGNVIALTTPLSLANGGTNASLTASAGGIVWSTGSAFAVLSGTATASQVLLSGSSVTPAWSTATYPGTAAAGTVLGAASANVVAATATPTLGAVGTQGQLKLSGTTSGTVTQTTAAAAGTPTVTWGSATGTPAVTATAPLSITASTGNLALTGVAGQVLGGSGATFTATPTLGAVGTQGQLILAGTTSGTVTQTTAAAAGTPTVTWGSSSGTPAVTATGPLAITAATGNATCATCATTTNGGALTATAPVAISAAGVISLTNPLPVANGGTNGTSASGTLLDNITAFASTGFINRTGAGTYTFSTASQILDGIGSTQGNVLFRGAASWTALATGTAGQVLTTQGVGANPTWTTVTGTGTVTNVATGAGLTGGPITTTGTITLNGISPQGRLTLTANTPVMTASATNATTIRYDCYSGGLVPYFDGTNDQTESIASCEVTDAMVATATSGGLSANSVFDVWWVHSGANRICVANGAAAGASGTGWAADTAGSNTARGTGYSQLDKTTRPYVTNKNIIANCWNAATQYGSVAVNQATYLGTIRTLAAGQVSYTLGAFGAGGPATAPAVLLWNQYNRQPWCVAFGDTNSSYAYTTTTWREADGSATMFVRFVAGQNEGSVTADYDALGNTTTNVGVTSIGVDTTSAFTAGATSGLAASTSLAPMHSSWRALPGLGDHFLAAIEIGDTGVTFVGQRLAGQQAGMSVCGQY